MNKCFFGGNLTRDPELKYVTSGKAVLNFGIAMNRKYKVGDRTENEVCYVDLEAWDKTAELINEYFKKGDAIYVECSVKMDTWERDDEKFSRLKFRVTEFNFPLGGGKKREEAKKDEDDNEPPKESAAPKSEPKKETKKATKKEPEPQQNDEDEVPF